MLMFTYAGVHDLAGDGDVNLLQKSMTWLVMFPFCRGL